MAIKLAAGESATRATLGHIFTTMVQYGMRIENMEDATTQVRQLLKDDFSPERRSLGFCLQRKQFELEQEDEKMREAVLDWAPVILTIWSCRCIS
jgi:hypothetical protein